MTDKFYKFKSKSELARYIGISRPTLNSRLVKLDVKITEVPFTLTPLQLDELTSNKIQNKNHVNPTSNPKSLKNLPEKSETTSQIEYLQEELHAQQEKLLELQNLRIAEQKEQTQRITDLTNKMIKIQDQAQQLQLDLQTKLNKSEQERLSLASKSQQYASTASQIDEKEQTITQLEKQIGTVKREKEALQEQIKSNEHYSDYLYHENKQIDNIKDELASTPSAFDETQTQLTQVLHQLNEAQKLIQKKEEQRQFISQQNDKLANKLKQTKHQLVEAENKGFWKRLFRQ